MIIIVATIILTAMITNPPWVRKGRANGQRNVGRIGPMSSNGGDENFKNTMAAENIDVMNKPTTT